MKTVFKGETQMLLFCFQNELAYYTYNTIRHTLFNFRGGADNKDSLKLGNSFTFCLTYKFDQFIVVKKLQLTYICIIGKGQELGTLLYKKKLCGLHLLLMPQYKIFVPYVGSIFLFSDSFPTCLIFCSLICSKV